MLSIENDVILRPLVGRNCWGVVYMAGKLLVFGPNSYLSRRQEKRYWNLVSREAEIRSAQPIWQRAPLNRLTLSLSHGQTPSCGAVSELLGKLSNLPVFEGTPPAVDLSLPIEALHPEVLELSSMKTFDLVSVRKPDRFLSYEQERTLGSLHTSLSQRTSLLLELSAGEWFSEAQTFREDLFRVYSYNPDFVSLEPSPDERHLPYWGAVCQSREIDPRFVKFLSLSTEVFEMLGYELVVMTPGRVVLMKSGLNPTRIEKASRVLGIGVGAPSRRRDRVGRRVESQNSRSCAVYRREVQRLEREEHYRSIGQLIPSLHRFIEVSLYGNSGLSYREVRDRFGVDLEKVHPGLDYVLERNGFLTRSDASLHLTERGRRTARNVVLNFFLGGDDLKYASCLPHAG